MNPRLFTGRLRHDPSDLIERLPELPQDLRNEPNFLCGDDEDHSDAEIEGSPEIIVWNIAEFLQQREDGLLGPGMGVDFGRTPRREDARDIVGEAPPVIWAAPLSSLARWSA